MPWCPGKPSGRREKRTTLDPIQRPLQLTAWYLLSRHEAPRSKILRVPIVQLDRSKAATVVAEGTDTIVGSFWEAPSVLPTENRLYLLYQRGGTSKIRVFDLDGKPQPTPRQLAVAAADGLTPIRDDEVPFANWFFVEPPAFFRYGGTGEETTKTALAARSPVDLSRVRVVREMATSNDGTRVPVNILLPRGRSASSPGPCVVNGHGG